MELSELIILWLFWITCGGVGGLIITAIIKAIWFDPEHGAFMLRITKKMFSSSDWDESV